MKTRALKEIFFVVLPAILAIAGSILALPGCGPSRRDLEEQATSQGALAEKNFNNRKYSEALAATREAIRLNTDLRDDSAMTDDYLLLANCQRQLGDYDSALISFERTIEYFRSLNDQHLERRARIALADFYQDAFDDTNALAIASEAATAAKVFSDVGDSYRALKIVARASHRLGRYENELATLAELARIDSQVNHGRDRVSLLRSMAGACEGTGDPVRSAALFNRWMASAVMTGDSNSLAQAEYEWGLYMQSLGRPDSALGALSHALGYVSRHHEMRLQTQILYALGDISYRAEQFSDARRHYADALDLAQRGNMLGLKEVLRLAMVACESKGHPSPASAAGLVKRCSASAEECRQFGFRAGQALANFISGRLLEAADSPAAAIPCYRRALDLQEGEPASPADRTLDFVSVYLRGERTGWHDPLIRLYCASARPDSAFTAIERKNLVDISDFFSHIPFKNQDQRLTQKISAIQWNLNALQLLEEDVLDELGTSDPLNSERLVSLNSKYPGRESQIARSVGELTGMDANFAWLLHPRLLRLSAIRDTLPPNSALLEFASTGDTLYALVIRAGRSTCRKTPVRHESLLAMIRDYNRLAGENRLNTNGTWITDPANQARLNALSSVMGKLLLSPVMQDLSGVEKLYVTLPADFGWLPVHTLRWEDRPLAERLNISYLPTAAVLLFSSPRELPVRRVAGIGHPGRTSWDVEYELKDIRGFYDKAPMYFDTMATLDHLKDSVYDVIHVAAEFQLERDVPNDSRLILADGNRPFSVRGVTLGELPGIPRPQALVFSNISSRAGGFSRYPPLVLLANGTRNVIASMWQLDRKAKKYFGEGFYTGLLGGLPAGEAYRQAIGRLLKQGEFALLQRWGAYYQFGR